MQHWRVKAISNIIAALRLLGNSNAGRSWISNAVSVWYSNSHPAWCCTLFYSRLFCASLVSLSPNRQETSQTVGQKLLILYIIHYMDRFLSNDVWLEQVSGKYGYCAGQHLSSFTFQFNWSATDHKIKNKFVLAIFNMSIHNFYISFVLLKYVNKKGCYVFKTGFMMLWEWCISCVHLHFMCSIWFGSANCQCVLLVKIREKHDWF